MAVSKKELQRWVNTLPDDAQVGVDEGGLTLCVVGDADTYYEVGGLPEDDDSPISEDRNYPPNWEPNGTYSPED
jgi:hypothetical protein